ncbi:MAG: dihydroneopterin aldolase, partial [Epsilonproteobacteria bacterium]|nr:dihydroneopterin aldolase [Campylobacterota bacterium]
MIIHIENLKFQCIIGILDFERETPQDVIINLTIRYN